MRRTTTLTAALLIAALATGCSSDTDNKPTVAKASATPTSASPTPAPKPSPSRETFRVGDTAEIKREGGEFTAAVISYRDKGIKGVPELLSGGQKWAVVEVKVCNTGGETFAVSPFPWSLAYGDGARVEAAGMNAGELPQPLYPMDAKVRVGDCVRGNIVFQVPESGRPGRVLYSPEDLVEPVEWLVGKG